MKIVENTMELSDWIRTASWDLPYTDLDGFFKSKYLTNATIEQKVKAIRYSMSLPSWKPAPEHLKDQAIRFIHDTRKSVDLETLDKGVLTPIDIERALARLTILPNPNHPDLKNPEKFVESPWRVVPTPTVDPALWDGAKVDLLDLNDLYATDPFMRRKNVAKHIESLGQSLLRFRSYAMVANVEGRSVIIDGHHRLFALWLLGHDVAPVYRIEIE
jgi:hypothetical protein